MTVFERKYKMATYGCFKCKQFLNVIYVKNNRISKQTTTIQW